MNDDATAEPWKHKRRVLDEDETEGGRTSSADSECDSVLSAIFNGRGQPPAGRDGPAARSPATPRTPDDAGRGDVFTYRMPVSAETAAIAAAVYVLIDHGQCMTAGTRLMWYLKRLGAVLTVDEPGAESPEQCRVVSFVPREDGAGRASPAAAAAAFVMDSATRVYFLTSVCNMVYCLDMSPSNCSVDIQRGHVMLDEMVVALKRSIKGFIRPFIVPGSDDLLFEPQVYVTVIVHTPFYTSLAQQVLVQGWLINYKNFNEFITTVTSEMNRLENALAKTKIIKIQNSDDDEDDIGFNNDYDNNANGNANYNSIFTHHNRKLSNNNSLSSHSSSKSRHNNENFNKHLTPVANTSPDSGFINTLRYGMLAFRLLPRSSISNLIVITDGMITLADIQVLDSVLNQLRYIGVACSFFHVSSQFHPNSTHGLVPYSELMQLISTATCGFYLNSFPKTILNRTVNYYHDKFIMWSFKRGDEHSNNTASLSCTPTCVRSGEWTVRNTNFYGNRQNQLVSKKQISDHFQANLDNIVCCRMREGFLIEDIQFGDAKSNTPVENKISSSKLHLKFILPWTNHIYIEYDLTMKWPCSIISKFNPTPVQSQNIVETQVPSNKPQPTKVLEPDDSSKIHFTIIVKGPYEFLHDITCNRGKKSQLLTQLAPKYQFNLSSCRSSSISITASSTTITKNDYFMSDSINSGNKRVLTSKYRQALITRFWSAMRLIVQSDLLIKHLGTYSPNTGHLTKQELSRQQNESHDRQQHPPVLENQPSPQIQVDDLSSLSPNSLNNSVPKIDTSVNIGITEAKSGIVSIPGVPNRSPLRSGIPLFYRPPTSSNNPLALKQSQVRLNDQQGYDQQHRQFAEFWKPVCTLDPETQWPKWFSTYRVGGGVIILKHDRPLPAWLHVANPINNRYQTLSCREASDALFALLKQWCSFILIDDHSYVKCLDESETQTGYVSFCIAQVSLISPTCCCVVLYLAFQSCVPVYVHHKVIDDLKKSIELLDSVTAIKPLDSVDNDKDLTSNEENEKKAREESKEKELEQLTKSTPLQRYLYILDKPLEKILIRYERIPSQFTTVIFPDGSQPYPAPAITTSNIIKPNPKLSVVRKPFVSQEVPTGIEQKTVTTTTTLSRYLYHRRWIWSIGYKRYNRFNSNSSQMLQVQLARAISVLTNIRLKEGFKFAHSSSGIVNMVLKVDMIEGSSSCPSTPTSHCVIQYVLFPPNIPHKYRLKDQIDMLKKKSNEDERSSTSSFDELQWEKRQKHGRNTITSETGESNCCCSIDNTEDDYQLITECWIEPQHGKVVTNKKLNVDYMSGLMYEQLADAMWQVDFDCISSLYTFDHMQNMCLNHDVPVAYPDYDMLDADHNNKTVVVDAGRIYKLPFPFSLVNLLHKSRHQSLITYNLFTLNEDSDTGGVSGDRDDIKLNKMLEHSFYKRMRTINDRKFDVDDSKSTVDLNQMIAKVNDQDIGLCFIKRLDDSRLILTVAPSFEKEQYSIANSTEDGFEPLNRSRANTWHHTKRADGLLCPQPLDDSKHYFRTLSVGSKPLTTTDMSWDQLKNDHDLLWSPDPKDIQSQCISESGNNLPDLPTNIFVEVYECQKKDIENILMFDSYTIGQSNNNKNTGNKSSLCNSTTNSEEIEENSLILRQKKLISEEPADPLLLDKYLQKVGVVYDQSFVTTVFHALHLGLNVQHKDIQRAIDRCHKRLVTFEITNYIKVVCDHFKENSNTLNTCPSDNTTSKLHHNLIQATFSSILDRHMLKPVDNYSDYFFYDFIEKFSCDDDSDDSHYTTRQSVDDDQKQSNPPNIFIGKPAHKTNYDSYDVEEQDLFPLFVQLMCTVKTDQMTKSQVVHSLPTCIIELMNHGNENESTRNLDLTNLKVSLEVHCLVTPYHDCDESDDEDDYDIFNKTISLEQLHFPINSNSISSIKHIESYEKPFIYLSAILPTRHAQGLAAFIAEVEWCMRDEMAAGLLKDPVVTPDTLNKVIEHVSTSPCSSANDHQKLVIHFVPTLRSSSPTNVELFLQKLDQLDIILDIGNDNVDRLYTLAKSTNDTFYVVKKDIPISSNSEIKTSKPCLTKPVLPNFWMILKIQESKKCQKENNFGHVKTNINTLIVNVFFHCRFTELDVEGRYSAIRESVKLNVQQTATLINQTVLLSRLHDTRICDPLLEPVIEGHSNSDDDENNMEEMDKITKYFNKGQFKCPIVWSTTFSLHPRIQQSTPLLIFGGVHVLSSILSKFSIRNRRNMFVYKESESGSVFYLRFYKNSNSIQENQTYNGGDTSIQYDSEDEDSISRCSSATSTTLTASHSIFSSYNCNMSRKYSEDLNFMDSKAVQFPGTRPFGGLWATDLRDVENLICNVHGISPVGTEIRIDLVEVLQNRLNDAVLEVLTTLLYRNPSCRLFLDDVRFIQPVDSPIDLTLQISLPTETKVTKYFARTLKRNAAKFSLYPPKFFSPYERFNYSYGTSDVLKPVIRSYFLYNYPCSGNSGVRPFSGKRGLACILYDIYSYEHNSIDNSHDYPMDSELFEKRVKTTFIDDNLKSSTDHSGYVKIFVWGRGRVIMESLQKKITSIVTYTLWDIYLEQFFYEETIVIEKPGASVNPLCIQFLTKWIAFGARLGVPFAHHFQIQCRLHIDHVLREFKTHLSWFESYTSNKVTTLSTRYFYVPSTQYGQPVDGESSNLISDSPDPLQLDQKQDNNLINNLVFYEWKMPNNESVICPPSAACVLIVVSVTYKKKIKQKLCQNQKIDNEQSDSDTDNAVAEHEDEENLISEEDKPPDSLYEFSSVKQTTEANGIIEQIQKPNKHFNKVTKLLLLAISGQSVHTLSYNCHNNDDQLTTTHNLSHWLELRRMAFESSVYKMLELRDPCKFDKINGSRINKHLSKIKSNPDILLDYKRYVAYIEENEFNIKTIMENSSRRGSRTSKSAVHNDNGTDDKKKKPLVFKKDFHDIYIAKLVKNYKEQRRTETHQLILYEMWTQVHQRDITCITREALRVFYSNSRLFHFCLTPLLFLTTWRYESHSTREYSTDANKTKDIFSAPQPLWHKRLCARLTNYFAKYIETNPIFSDLLPVRVNGSCLLNNGVSMEMDYNKSSTRYYKLAVTGDNGGLLLLETGVSQPFFYIKLSYVDKSMIGSQLTNESPSMLALNDRLQTITQKMHFHSFTYDFHACILSERLKKLAQKQKLEKRTLSIVLDNLISSQNCTNKSESGSVKNVITGFFDDFLKYYEKPPLYSNCLILQGVINRTKLSVTSIQLYEYMLNNCSHDCKNTAVIRMSDSESVEKDDGSFLFDDDVHCDASIENAVYGSQSKSRRNNNFILVRHMSGNEIQQNQKSKIGSNVYKSGINTNSSSAVFQYEACGLYDLTLVMTLSVKNLQLGSSDGISLPYYVMVTKNNNSILEKKEMASDTDCSIQQPHSTSIHITRPRSNHNNKLSSSGSMPISCFGNFKSFQASHTWGSLTENSAHNDPSLPDTSPISKDESIKNELDPHKLLEMEKNNFIKFYEDKAAELVALTIDSATKRCFSHLLWQKFNKFFDQPRGGPITMTLSDIDEIKNTSEFIKSFAEYDKKFMPLIEDLSKDPLWFNMLHKLIIKQTMSSSSPLKTMRYRIFKNNNSEHQYLVILPNNCSNIELNVFIIIDNGVVSEERVVPTVDSLITIVFKRNVVGSEELNELIETVGNILCFHTWRSLTTTAPRVSKVRSLVKKIFKI